MIIPTLMYHSVDKESEDYLTVSYEMFRQHIIYLASNYDVLHIRDAFALTETKITEQRAIPVVITFDDAFLDNYSFALPVLEEYAVKAVFFVPAAYIGKDNRWDHKAYRIARHMGVSELKELHLLGHEIGNHSLTHQRITKLFHKEIVYEYTEANRILAEITGETPRFFAYPYGAADSISSEISGKHFLAGFTTVREGAFDWNSDRSRIRRIYVSPADKPEDLVQKILCYSKGMQHD